jgi:ADP-ribose pyrophosphatase YjhB (NUDIX family)
MRIQAYLRVLGDEATVRAIHEETNVHEATVKELKSHTSVVGETRWWNWQTTRMAIDNEDPDQGIKSLLIKHRSIFPAVRKYRNIDIYLEIIVQYDANEDHQGLYLSSETIALLSELGGALDYDIVSLMN